MRVVICGIGTVGSELARRLCEARHDVIIIDSSKAICDQLYAQHGVVAICGNPAELEVLQEAEVSKADLVVATSPHDADNLACAMLSKSLGVPQIIVRLHNKAYSEAYRIVGVNAMVPVTDLTVNHILMEIEHPRANNITSIGGGLGEIFMLVVPATSWAVGRTVAEVAASPDFPPECVFAAAYRPSTDEVVIPRGRFVLQAGDEIYLIAIAAVVERAIDGLLRPAP